MHLVAAVGIGILEFLFFAGWIGSLLVILLSGIEDFETIFTEDDPGSGPSSPPVRPTPSTSS